MSVGSELVRHTQAETVGAVFVLGAVGAQLVGFIHFDRLFLEVGVSQVNSHVIHHRVTQANTEDSPVAGWDAW